MVNLLIFELAGSLWWAGRAGQEALPVLAQSDCAGDVGRPC